MLDLESAIYFHGICLVLLASVALDFSGYFSLHVPSNGNALENKILQEGSQIAQNGLCMFSSQEWRAEYA